ncbi:recombinase family protein [Caballeronia sp. LZ019]|uniref:recombinase family protein n=1 Tax=Caballeronia sp. LZ019 TaxID=3038555 RepID=UPI0028669A3E|nr:recombinase family protein [Caballeronia sp. LZ019]MDR5811190.1 recombinase family protein [Caballeronia sp. LZ019]
MAQGQFVAYYRVSTARQGQSGLGLEAQREAVARYLNGGDWELVGEFTDTETGKGANALEKRPQLRTALELCKRRGATLIIAKLDRLARNVHFVSGLLETGCDFVAADMPAANKVMIQMHAVMAEWERDQISKRTRDALAAAKARGVRLGVAGPTNLKPNLEVRQRAANAFADKLAGVITGFRSRNLSQREMVAQLNALGIRTPNGGTWHRGQLCRLLERIGKQTN